MDLCCEGTVGMLRKVRVIAQTSKIVSRRMDVPDAIDQFNSPSSLNLTAISSSPDLEEIRLVLYNLRNK